MVAMGGGSGRLHWAEAVGVAGWEMRLAVLHGGSWLALSVVARIGGFGVEWARWWRCAMHRVVCMLIVHGAYAEARRNHKGWHSRCGVPLGVCRGVQACLLCSAGCAYAPVWRHGRAAWLQLACSGRPHRACADGAVHGAGVVSSVCGHAVVRLDVVCAPHCMCIMLVGGDACGVVEKGAAVLLVATRRVAWGGVAALVV